MSILHFYLYLRSMHGVVVLVKEKFEKKLEVQIKDYKLDKSLGVIYTFKHHFTNLSNQLSQVIKCSNGIGISDNTLYLISN